MNNHNQIKVVPDWWWRHQMETFSALLALCAGNSPVTSEFSAQRPVTRSFYVFFYLRLNKRLSKQSWGWWFETPSRSLWRHCNDNHWYRELLHNKIYIEGSVQGCSNSSAVTLELLQPCPKPPTCHDDVIKWKHFPRYWPFVRGIHRSPVNSPHKGRQVSSSQNRNWYWGLCWFFLLRLNNAYLLNWSINCLGNILSHIQWSHHYLVLCWFIITSIQE